MRTSHKRKKSIVGCQ